VTKEDAHQSAAVRRPVVPLRVRAHGYLRLGGQRRQADGQYRLKVRVSGKSRTFTGKLDQYETSYTVALCTNGTRATVMPTLIDPAGHRSTAAAKRLKLRG
jgi:hypothetical protein